MSESSRGAVIVVVIVIMTIFLYMLWNPGGVSQAPSSGPMQIDQPAPDFTITAVDGSQIQLSDYIGRKAVVIDFWATWCGPCMMELPVLQEFYQANSADVEIIAVSSEDAGAAASIENVVSDKRLTFPVIHDPAKSIDNLYPHRAIPYLVFIDIDGIVVHAATGYNPKISDEIKELFGL